MRSFHLECRMIKYYAKNFDFTQNYVTVIQIKKPKDLGEVVFSCVKNLSSNTSVITCKNFFS